MSEDPRLAAFLERFRSQVLEAALEEAEGADDVAATAFREEAFTRVMLDFLEDHGHLSDVETCYVERRIGRGVGKLNAWQVDGDNGTAALVTTIYRGIPEPSSIPASELNQAVERALRVFAEARNGLHHNLEPASCEFDMMERIYNEGAVVDQVRVVVLADGFAADYGQTFERNDGLDVRIDVWDLRRVFRVDSSGLPYEPVEVDFLQRLGRPLPGINASDGNADFDVYLTVIPGDLLHAIYHEYGPRILELNVRSFLQARGKVNRGIRDSLKNEPSRFVAYNNGISATAESVELATGPEGIEIRRLTGLQIVNGGQTVASIHRAKQRDRQDLSEVAVQAKITVIRPDQIDTLVPQISRYANTQNRVNEADFSANHPFHVALQKLSQTVWAPGQQYRWFYERARGQYEVAQQREGTTPARLKRFKEANPPKMRFDKVKLAKYANSWDQLPHVVSRGGQKNFLAFMQRLHNTHSSSWEPDAGYFQRTVAKAIVFKCAEGIARRHSFPGYRANAIAYTVSLVSYRTAGRVDLGAIWDAQRVTSALSETMHDWMPMVYEALIESAGGRNVTEWCKKEECWRLLQTLDVQVAEALQKELEEGQSLPTVGSQAQRGQDALTEEDRENIARVMQIPAEVWVHISGWGSRSGELQSWQCGIAATLASYAAAGWNQVPSKKQAARGSEILRTAVESGGMPEQDFL